MPRGDRTGPAGGGSMTGRGAGYCAGYAAPGFMNTYGARGFFGRGRGGGFGRGYRHMYWATGLPGWVGSGGYGPADIPAFRAPTPQQEAEALKNQVQYLQDSMNALNERIRELENTQTESDA